MTNYVLERPILGTAAGSILGGLLTSAWLTFRLWAASPVSGRPQPDATQLANWGLLSFVMATIVFMIGLLFIGVPAWKALHSRGFRGPWMATSLGAALSYGTTVVYDLTSHHVVFYELGAVLLALAGAIVGWTIQRVAYARADPIKPPSAPPA